MPRKGQRSQSQKLRWQKQKEQVNVSQSGEEVKVSVTTVPSPEVQSSAQTAAVSYADVVKRGVRSACVSDAKVQQVIQTELQVTVQTQHDGEAPGPSHVQVTNSESHPRVSSICASRSQASAKYGKYRNQQCMANSLVFLSFLHEDEFITRADLNRVLDKGHAVYSDARKRFVNSVFLASDELPTVVTSRRHEYQVDMSQFAHYGTFDGRDHLPSLEQGLQCLASAVRYALLVMGGTVIAVCRLTSGEYAYFDPHPRSKHLEAPECERPRRTTRRASVPPSWEELRRAPDEGLPSSHGAEARAGCTDMPTGSAGSQLCQTEPSRRPRGRRPEGPLCPGRGLTEQQAPGPAK
ncbi:unnamed protein product [Oreochromis niloticus]|nr:unnamed protein product [Mustela putorius furo]